MTGIAEIQLQERIAGDCELICVESDGYPVHCIEIFYKSRHGRVQKRQKIHGTSRTLIKNIMRLMLDVYHRLRLLPHCWIGPIYNPIPF